MSHRLFTAFLVFLAGCEGSNRAPRLPVRSEPARLPVSSGPTTEYKGKCGCGCGSFACLYGNCGKSGVPACCDKCTCSTIEEINKKGNEIIEKAKHEELNEQPKIKLLDPEPIPPVLKNRKPVDDLLKLEKIYPSLPGPSDPAARRDQSIESQNRKWYPVPGRPGLWVFGVMYSNGDIKNITKFWQDSSLAR